MLLPLIKLVLALRAVSSVQFAVAAAGAAAESELVKNDEPPTGQGLSSAQSNQDSHAALPAALNNIGASLEPRMSDKNFIADILNRLHSLDADIGKLLFNSSSMYAADDQSEAFRQNQPTGGERFTEVLSDLDSLQDEVGVLINNATRARQYNMLVRLRPINTILYRIRHNLHLMRNSLVTINAIAGLERVSNDVLDTTLQAFLQPDANVSHELSDDGNYDIDLNKLSPNASSTLPPTTTTTQTTTTSTTTTTTTTTRPPPPPTTPSTTTTRAPSSSPTTRRATRPPNRRTNNRNNQRRNSTTSTQKPTSTSPLLSTRQ